MVSTPRPGFLSFYPNPAALVSVKSADKGQVLSLWLNQLKFARYAQFTYLERKLDFNLFADRSWY